MSRLGPASTTMTSVAPVPIQYPKVSSSRNPIPRGMQCHASAPPDVTPVGREPCRWHAGTSCRQKTGGRKLIDARRPDREHALACFLYGGHSREVAISWIVMSRGAVPGSSRHVERHVTTVSGEAETLRLDRQHPQALATSATGDHGQLCTVSDVCPMRTGSRFVLVAPVHMPRMSGPDIRVRIRPASIHRAETAASAGVVRPAVRDQGLIGVHGLDSARPVEVKYVNQMRVSPVFGSVVTTDSSERAATPVVAASVPPYEKVPVTAANSV